MTETTKQVTEQLFRLYKTSLLALVKEDKATASDLFNKHSGEIRRLIEGTESSTT